MDVRKQVNQQLARLSPSDRRALLLLSGFFVVVLCYMFLQHSFEYRAASVENLVETRKLTHKIDINREYLAASQGVVATVIKGKDDSLLNVASSQAKEFALKFKRFQPEDDQVLRIWLENVPFNRLLGWLHTLKKDNGVTVQKISVDRQDVSGRADATVTLQRILD
jgi:general secretion pathway protein M